MSQHVTYDPDVIQLHARQLYRRASSIIILSTILGALAVPVALSFPAHDRIQSGDGSTILLVGMLIGAGIGYVIGAGRAFVLKLQAQLALCQAQIAENTLAACQSLLQMRHGNAHGPMDVSSYPPATPLAPPPP